MGAGSRLNPLDIRVDDISKTTHCPLARIIRKRLKEEGIEKGVRCIYSRETSISLTHQRKEQEKKSQGSISYMPGIFGLTAAGIIINDIIKSHGE
jgi:tRNA A37 threonylcarbamoyladenosine dehydratase